MTCKFVERLCKLFAKEEFLTSFCLSSVEELRHQKHLYHLLRELHWGRYSTKMVLAFENERFFSFRNTIFNKDCLNALNGQYDGLQSIEQYLHFMSKVQKLLNGCRMILSEKPKTKCQFVPLRRLTYQHRLLLS